MPFPEQDLLEQLILWRMENSVFNSSFPQIVIQGGREQVPWIKPNNLEESLISPSETQEMSKCFPGHEFKLWNIK